MLGRARKRLDKRAKKGFHGYPVATVALYGPDDTRATKLAVGIVPAEDAEVTDLRRWFSEGADIRNDAGVAEEVLAFIDAAGARSIVMTDRIIGCPHEEGIDYQGPSCPSCPSGPDAIAGLASAYTRLVRVHKGGFFRDVARPRTERLRRGRRPFRVLVAARTGRIALRAVSAGLIWRLPAPGEAEATMSA